MSESFNFSNFTPRTGVEEKSNRILGRFLTSLRKFSGCRAHVTRQNMGFYFSIVVSTEKGIFSTDSLVPIYKCRRLQRNWQVQEVHSLVFDLKQQIRSWGGEIESSSEEVESIS